MPVTEPPWLNASTGIAARNGTTSHTINFGFTSASGSFLVFVIYGGVTHTAAGWTERLSPVNSGELSVFTKTSAGDSSITVTHNGSNYPTPWVAFEYPSGTTYTAGIGNDITSDTFPALTGLPGTEQVIHAARGRISDNPAHTTPPTSVWSAPWVEDADLFSVDDGTTDGAYLTAGHQINYTGTSVTPAAATTYSGQTAEREHVVFALSVPSGSSTVNGTATAASVSTLTATAVVVRAGTAALSSTSALSATAVLRRLGAATAASTSTLTATGRAVRLGVATAASASTLTATATVVRLGTAALSSTSSLTGAVAGTSNGTAAIASTSALTASAAVARAGTAAIGSTSSLAAAAIVVRQGSAALASASTLQGAASLAVPATASLVGSSSLTAAAARIVPAAAALASFSSLSAGVGSFNQPGALATSTAAARLQATDSAPHMSATDEAAQLVATAWP